MKSFSGKSKAGKIFEGETFIRTFLLQLFCEINHNFPIIAKSLDDSEDNFEFNLSINGLNNPICTTPQGAHNQLGEAYVKEVTKMSKTANFWDHF